jgi:hypothetical protein
MGLNADADFSYGYDLGSVSPTREDDEYENDEYENDEYENDDFEDDEYEDDSGDFDEFVSAAYDRLLAAAGYTEHPGDGPPARDKRRSDAIADLGIMFVSYGEAEGRSGCVMAVRTVTAGATPVLITDFDLPDGAGDRLDEAARVLDLDVADKTPGWLLTSYFS